MAIDEQLEAEIMALRTEIDRLDFAIYGHNSDEFNRLHFTEKKKKVQELVSLRARLLELREKQARLNRNYL